MKVSNSFNFSVRSDLDDVDLKDLKEHLIRHVNSFLKELGTREYGGVRIDFRATPKEEDNEW